MLTFLNLFKIIFNVDAYIPVLNVIHFSKCYMIKGNYVLQKKKASLFFLFFFTGLRFLRALRLIQFSEILQFLNILKTR